MAKKINLHYLAGDVHRGGHDIHRVAINNRMLLGAAGAFDITMACDYDAIGDLAVQEYFKKDIIREADVIVYDLGNWFKGRDREKRQLEDAVKGGAGLVFLHGGHPCYWFADNPWPEFEKMVGFLWREKTTHGDFGYAKVTIDRPDHPIMQGLADFETRDEIFCTMENPHNVPYEVLASAYSDPATISRHGLPGTGAQEGCAMVLRYGEGRVFNYSLGHVWPYYTGHGLAENTLASYRPLEFRKILVRACEYVATGRVEQTLGFDGKVVLQ